MLKREDFELRKEAAAASKLARRDQLRCVGGVGGWVGVVCVVCVGVGVYLSHLHSLLLRCNYYYGQFRYTGDDS